MAELNCINIDKACESLSVIIQIKKQTLIRKLSEYNPIQLAEDSFRMKKDQNIVLRNYLLSNTIEIIPDSIVWFHATRVLPGTTFSKGILPLNMMLETIKDMINDFGRSINVPNDSYIDCEENNYLSLYSMKTQDSMHWGPCAFLTRDAIIDPSPFTVRYLDTPEIIDEIAHVFYGSYANTILSLFRAKTVPCIVHFRDTSPRNDVISFALEYCYACIHNIRPLGEKHTCFDNIGEPVLNSAIIDIEYLPDFSYKTS